MSGTAPRPGIVPVEQARTLVAAGGVVAPGEAAVHVHGSATCPVQLTPAGRSTSASPDSPAARPALTSANVASRVRPATSVTGSWARETASRAGLGVTLTPIGGGR